MSKRKADSFGEAPPKTGAKKVKQDILKDLPLKNKPAQLLDSDSDSDDESVSGGASLEAAGFKINEEYAKRFEHNKKREELHKLEEKYKSKSKDGDEIDDNEDDDSSTSEEEDDEGFLATEDLDAEISATLQAIRSKDPRLYDEKVTFYKPIEEGDEEVTPAVKQEKPMYLKDYHRENLMKGHTGAENEEEPPRTYVQEQAHLKKSIIQDMHAAANGDEEDEDEDFLTAKSKPEIPKGKSEENGVDQSRGKKGARQIELDVENADKDPELFLSNFMSSRAWVANDELTFQPFESDDDEEQERAEQFEAAYNLRFEDPENSNEVLKSYARDIVAAKSVRREETKGRKKQREFERERKDAAKRERDEERARLRKLKIEQVEEKLQKIKKTAGLSGKIVKDEDWAKFLNEGWDDDKWDEEMNKRFGADYYAEQEFGSAAEESDAEDAANDDGSKKKMKKLPKKPKWDDDIDIKDLVPEFEVEEESHNNPTFTLSDSEDADEATSNNKPKSTRDHKQAQAERKRAARLERKKIEDIVDAHLPFDLIDSDNILPSTSSKSKPQEQQQPTPKFRYRETSPTTFGLTARDILFAPSDTALNQFVGLKKMATFRDAEKKRKDKKRLGKKARLREWRLATFGREDGPVFAPSEEEDGEEKGKKKVGSRNDDDVDGGVLMGEGGAAEGERKKKKRKRSKKGKSITTTTIPE